MRIPTFGTSFFEAMSLTMHLFRLRGPFRGGDDDFEDVLVLVEEQVGNTEACNGVDDDCDGRVNENASVRCETECGSGLMCQAGQLLTYNAPEPSRSL